MYFRSVSLVVVACCLGGCAHMTVYDASLGTKDFSDAKKIGIPAYKPVPHLLVRYNAEKDKPFSSELIMLPDMSDPYYIVQHGGIGSNTTALGMQNGILTSVNSATDSKVPETLNAAAGLITSAAGAATSLAPLFAAAAPPPSEEEEEASASTAETGAALAVGLLSKTNRGLVAMESFTDAPAHAKPLTKEEIAAIIEEVLNDLRRKDVKNDVDKSLALAKAVKTSIASAQTQAVGAYATMRGPLDAALASVDGLITLLGDPATVDALASKDTDKNTAIKLAIVGKIAPAVKALSGISFAPNDPGSGAIQSAVVSSLKALGDLQVKYSLASDPFFKLFRIELDKQGQTFLTQVYPLTTH